MTATLLEPDARPDGSRTADLAFERALAGRPCWVVDARGHRRELPVRRWLGGPCATDDDRAADVAVLAECTGPTVDLGCGPGRLTAALTLRGVAALGVDTSALAVRLTLARGGLALRRDLFATVPGEGRWERVLLADGNIGIGGDPLRVLRRARDLLTVDGLVVCEVDASGPVVVDRVRLESDRARAPWFRWARLGADHIAAPARGAGLEVRQVRVHGDRAVVVLGRLT